MNIQPDEFVHKIEVEDNVLGRLGGQRKTPSNNFHLQRKEKFKKLSKCVQKQYKFVYERE